MGSTRCASRRWCELDSEDSESEGSSGTLRAASALEIREQLVDGDGEGSLRFSRQELRVKNGFIHFHDDTSASAALRRSCSAPAVLRMDLCSDDGRAVCVYRRSKKGRRRHTAEPDTHTFEVSPAEVELVMGAVTWLLDQGVEAEYKTLQRRLQELRPGRSFGEAWLRAACRQGEALGVEVEEGRKNCGSKFSVTIRGRRPVAAPPVRCPAALVGMDWDEVANGITSNYELARFWKDTVPELRGCLLGSIKKLVADLVKDRVIGRRKDGEKMYLVPFLRSKDACNLEEVACSCSGTPEELRQRVHDVAILLADMTNDQGEVLLSAFTPRFREKFEYELNHLGFGCRSVSEFLRKPEFHGVCQVVQDGTKLSLRLPKPGSERCWVRCRRVSTTDTDTPTSTPSTCASDEDGVREL